MNLVPRLAPIPGSREKIGRIGIVLGYEHVGVVQSAVEGVKLVGWSVAESFREIGHVFGPQGVGRLFTLLFTNAPRTDNDPTSVIGIGQQIGATSSSGDWGGVFLGFAFITVFIGLINLVPLPPFDGGHLFVLLIEKIRGKADRHAQADPGVGGRDGFLHRLRGGDHVPRHREADPAVISSIRPGQCRIVATSSQHRPGSGATLLRIRCSA